MENQGSLSYAGVIPLAADQGTFLRFIKQRDREGFAEPVGEAEPEGLIVLKPDFRDRETLRQWFDSLH